MLNFKLADLIKDKQWLDAAKYQAAQVLETDPELKREENSALKFYLQAQKGKLAWSRIS
jgi:ATP-dependent DNA helicase RecG